MAPPDVQFQRLEPEAVLPRYMSDGAAGLDLSACVAEPVCLQPGQRAAIGTGLAMAIPAGYEGQVRPRSGLAATTGLTVLNAPGTIDCDYRGEVKVLLINLGGAPATIETGMRIAQLVIAPVARVAVAEVQSLSPTARASGGFGSTGT